MKNIRFTGFRIDPVAYFGDSILADYRSIEGQFWKEVISYGEDGHLYKMKGAQPLPKRTFLQKLNGLLGHNPEVVLGVAWIKGKTYQLSDLKSRIRECIEATDDLYLSFHSESEVQDRVTNAETFEQLHDLCFELIAGPPA